MSPETGPSYVAFEAPADRVLLVRLGEPVTYRLYSLFCQDDDEASFINWRSVLQELQQRFGDQPQGWEALDAALQDLGLCRGEVTPDEAIGIMARQTEKILHFA